MNIWDFIIFSKLTNNKNNKNNNGGLFSLIIGLIAYYYIIYIFIVLISSIFNIKLDESFFENFAYIYGIFSLFIIIVNLTNKHKK